MYHAPSKLKLRLRLALVYTLMVVSVIALVAMLFFIMQGYRFNRYDGRVEQGGLVQFDTKPGGADVWVDQAHLANKTPAKITVTAGEHTIAMWKRGYHDWRSDVTVKPGVILWLNYARLVPQILQQVSVAPVAKLSSSVTSPDFKSMAYVTDEAQPTLVVVGLDTNTPQPDIITLPESAYAKTSDGANGTFSVVSWSNDNRYVLIRHDVPGKTEWISVDTRGNHEARNITALLGIETHDIAFARGDSGVVYFINTAGELRRGDISARMVSGPLLANVEQFSQFDNATITFVTRIDPATKNRSVGYLTSGASAPRLVRSYADDGTTSLRFGINRYYNQNHYVFVYGDAVDILTGDLPASDAKNPSTLTPFATYQVAGGADAVQFSPESHRFILTANQTGASVYDLELKQASRVDFARPLTAMWIDEFHFATVASGGAVRMYDFNAKNSYDLLTKSLGGAVALTPNGKYFYGFTEQNSAPELTRVKLLVD